MVALSVDIDTNKQFRRAIDSAVKGLNDLTVPYKLMAREWFKANRSIFIQSRQGPGKYEDLSPGYKLLKPRKYGFVYPILRASGKLADSMTNPQSGDSINLIINRKTLLLGTKATTKKGAPYAAMLQAGTKKMPARPFVLLGVEQVADSTATKRLKNWINLLEDFAAQKAEKLGVVK